LIAKKAGLVGLAALVGALAAAAPSSAGGNKYSDSTVTRDCGDGDTVTLVGPLKLWPPNHKFVDEPVTATSGEPADSVTITITPTVTDAVGGDGGAQHDPDTNASDEGTIVGTGTGSATAAVALRAERSGKGDGRTYILNWVAQFGEKSCSSSSAEDSDVNNDPFVITVPHDMRGGADWK
jgi:hypothetical protein